MKLKKTTCLLCFCAILSVTALSQNNHPCLEEVLLYETLTNPSLDSSLRNRNVHLSYTVKVTNWEEETTVSNVKLYKKGNNVHFFSEQANIYLDENEALIIMPIQKLVILNPVTEEMSKRQVQDAFFDMRRSFLSSCQVLTCESKTPSTKLLALKVNPGQATPGVFIEKMTYEYDTQKQRLLTTTVEYREDYTVKRLQMIYRDLDTESTHTYAPVKSYALDRNGNLGASLKGYELLDNRDKNKKEDKHIKSSTNHKR
jgi:hypothetical protein